MHLHELPKIASLGSSKINSTPANGQRHRSSEIDPAYDEFVNVVEEQPRVSSNFLIRPATVPYSLNQMPMCGAIPFASFHGYPTQNGYVQHPGVIGLGLSRVPTAPFALINAQQSYQIPMQTGYVDAVPVGRDLHPQGSFQFGALPSTHSFSIAAFPPAGAPFYHVTQSNGATGIIVGHIPQQHFLQYAPASQQTFTPVPMASHSVTQMGSGSQMGPESNSPNMSNPAVTPTQSTPKNACDSSNIASMLPKTDLDISIDSSTNSSEDGCYPPQNSLMRFRAAPNFQTNGRRLYNFFLIFPKNFFLFFAL